MKKSKPLPWSTEVGKALSAYYSEGTLPRELTEQERLLLKIDKLERQVATLKKCETFLELQLRSEREQHAIQMAALVKDHERQMRKKIANEFEK